MQYMGESIDLIYDDMKPENIKIIEYDMLRKNRM
jgi:hypothetical protein